MGSEPRAAGPRIGLIDSTGSLATTYTYEPFGKPATSGQASPYPYLFAGMEYDANTGLYHTPARYYSPTFQRFLSEDPIGLGGDINLFGYAGNDPVNGADPSGLYCAYGFAGPESLGVAEGLGPEPSAGMHAFAATVLGAVSVGGASAAAGIGHGLGLPSGAGSLSIAGVQGHIVLAQVDEEEDPIRDQLEATESGLISEDEARAIGILRDAARGKGNFGLGGPVEYARALQLGKAYVGEDFTVEHSAKGTDIWISKDKLRQFRLPEIKRSGMSQANFEWRWSPFGQWQGNGHLDVNPYTQP